MLKRLNSYVFLFLCIGFLLPSCKEGKIFAGKNEKSSVTGWNYDDKAYGNFQVAIPKDLNTGPGLVFVQGGTFTMGATQEDVMADWNNVQRRVTVSSFLIDKTEVANVHYREYLHWLANVFQDPEYAQVLQNAYPDTLVWRGELSYNEPMVEAYFRFPNFNFYPVVGVSWKQAYDFCIWRTDRVNEQELIKKGYQSPNLIKQEYSGAGQDNFNTRSYLIGEFPGVPGKPKKNLLKDAQGRPRMEVKFEDGILFPDYRLPTEAEWEYAAMGMLKHNPQPRRSENKRGEEIYANRQLYSWKNDGYDNLRNTRSGKTQGGFLANFKRGAGDYMGTPGGLNDRAAYPAAVNTYYPNGFGLYNMSGNVSEWVADVYRPLTNMEEEDLNPYRGNIFKKVDLSGGEGNLRDSLGRLKYVQENDSLLRNRKNYQKSYAVNYMDGDSLSTSSYLYGITTLISDHSKVVKGGSWDDMPYWLVPGARRFLEEDQASSTIGFRCAMSYYGSSEGKGFKSGNYFSAPRQKR